MWIDGCQKKFLLTNNGFLVSDNDWSVVAAVCREDVALHLSRYAYTLFLYKSLNSHVYLIQNLCVFKPLELRQKDVECLKIITSNMLPNCKEYQKYFLDLTKWPQC